MRITPHYYSLIDPADPFDPIRKLAIPDFDELSREGTYDSSGEAANTVFDGLQHKYAATVFITEQ
jgi:lysine 2,3-aminomutase